MAGKEYTIVVLSSSPPVPDAFNSPRYAGPPKRVAMPPSSPSALSPPLSPRKHVSGALTSGSRAAPIPEQATRGFATVSSLVRSEHFAQQIDDDFTEPKQALRRQGSREGTEGIDPPANRPVKQATKKATPAQAEKPKPKPKPRAKRAKVDKEAENTTPALDPELRIPRTRTSPYFDNADAQPTTDANSAEPAPALTKSGKPRKPRTKKEKPAKGVTEPEPKPRKTRVTRSIAPAVAGKATRGAADDAPTHIIIDKEQASTTTSRHSQHAQSVCIWEVPQSPQSKQDAHKQRKQDLPVEGLDLAEAVSRRRDWTPPRDTFGRSSPIDSTGKENRHSTSDAMTSNFTHLISNFTYESPLSEPATNTVSSTTAPSGVAKRRRGELIELPGVQTTARASSPEKGKAPKKKPRTITDLVTGQYVPRNAEMETQNVTSDFFSPRACTKKVPLNDMEVPQADPLMKKPSGKRVKSRDSLEATKSKTNSRAKRTSTKPAAKSKPVAEKLLSPTSALMRMNRQEMLFGTSSQLALEESPATVRQIQRAIRESEQDVTRTGNSILEAPRWPGLQRVEGKRGLWRQSTRDSDGGLLEDEENVYIPAPDRTQDLPLLVDVVRNGPSSPSGFLDIDDIVPPAVIAISSDLPTPPEPQPQEIPEDLTPQKMLFDDIDDYDYGIPPSNQNVESQNSFADIDDFQLPLNVSMPLASAPLPVPAPATAPSPKRRGRPPKAQSAFVAPASAPQPAYQSSPRQSLQSPPPKGSARFIDIEEILDSEDEVLEVFSPTPPRVRKLQDSPPLPLTFDGGPSMSVNDQTNTATITSVVRISASHLEWANIRSSICAAITAHVRSIPPTTNPKQPSWHEKVLMYDPIILEDFTAYLNSNTKLRTYKRATQKQIKAYNSILKMRGDAILGVDRDDQVLAVEKELEVYMVRDWCQEMSICCIHAKERRGRGSARKGFY